MDTNFQGNEQVPVQGNIPNSVNLDSNTMNPSVMDSNMVQVAMPQPIMVDSSINGMASPVGDVSTSSSVSTDTLVNQSMTSSVSTQPVLVDTNVNSTVVMDMGNQMQSQVISQVPNSEVQVVPITNIEPVQISSGVVDANINVQAVDEGQTSTGNSVKPIVSSNDTAVTVEGENMSPELDSVNVQNIVAVEENKEQSIEIKESLEEKRAIEKQKLIVRPENLIEGKHYRISILTERLIRFE